ncbi:MAG: tRNA1(Val) (adenine(37)-N6)-methyltransferase [Alphaproteobacteria bacterium]
MTINNIATTKDDFLGGKLKIIQPVKGYRGGIDPVILASSITPESGSCILEVGSGTGIASLCLASRVLNVSIKGIEKQEELYNFSLESAKFNNLEDRVSFFNADIKNAKKDIEHASFDYVITNPPYYLPSFVSPNKLKATANADSSADLDYWLKFCIRALKHKGTLAMIFNAERIDEIMTILYGRVGGITITPLWSKSDSDAKRVIIKARKGLKSPTAITKGLLLHNEDGSFTDKASLILRQGDTLF